MSWRLILQNKSTDSSPCISASQKRAHCSRLCTPELLSHYFRSPPPTDGVTELVAFASDRQTAVNANRPVPLVRLPGPVWSRCVPVLSSRWRLFDVNATAWIIARMTDRQRENRFWMVNLSKWYIVKFASMECVLLLCVLNEMQNVDVTRVRVKRGETGLQ